MGWDGEQSYYMSVTAEQAAALVCMAEAFWRNPGGASDKGFESRIYCDSYRTIEESWVAAVTNGRTLYEVGYPDRISMTPDGPHIMRNALKISLQNIPVRKLVGIIFPFIYADYGIYQPVSFVFAQESVTRSPDRPWRLVTAVPFVANFGGADWTPCEQEQLDDSLWEMGLLHGLGTSFWPEDLIIQPSVVIGTRDGCRISLRKDYPSMVTAFLHFAQHQLRIVCDSEPNVDTTVEKDFRPDWEHDFKADRCFNDDPERIKLWRQAFGIIDPEAAPV